MKKYCGDIKIKYNSEEHFFELWIRTDGEDWDFLMSCMCYPTADNPSPEYIHFTFLKKLEEAIKLGYRLV